MDDKKKSKTDKEVVLLSAVAALAPSWAISKLVKMDISGVMAYDVYDTRKHQLCMMVIWDPQDELRIRAFNPTC
jgi:hypothetical protein